MKYIIFLELLVMSMGGGMTDTSSDINIVAEIANLKETTSGLKLKIGEQDIKIAKQNELIMEQNAKIANQDRLIMEQNAKIANQDRLIMEHRMSNAVQGNSVLQTQNNLLERSLSTMQQWNDQREELSSKISRLETLNETLMEFLNHTHPDIRNSMQHLHDQSLSTMQQCNDQQQELLSRLGTLNETVIDLTRHQHEDIQSSLQQLNDERDDLLSKISRLETLNETVMEIDQRQGTDAPVIAFGASLWRSFTGTKNNDKIVFNRIQTNIGNCYHDGVFTAPTDGLYVFQWTIVTVHGENGYTNLFVNGQRRRRNHCNSVSNGGSGFRTCSAAIPLHLGKGDRVWIVTYTGRYIYAYGYSAFQGWLQNIM